MRAGFKDAVTGMDRLLLQGCQESRDRTTEIRVSAITPPHRARWTQGQHSGFVFPDGQPLSPPGALLPGWHAFTKEAGRAASWGGPWSWTALRAWKTTGCPRGATAGAWPRPGLPAPASSSIPPPPALFRAGFLFMDGQGMRQREMRKRKQHEWALGSTWAGTTAWDRVCGSRCGETGDGWKLRLGCEVSTRAAAMEVSKQNSYNWYWSYE